MDDLVVFHSICTTNSRIIGTMTTTYRAQSEKHRVDIFTTYLPHISRFLTFLSHLFIKGLRLKYVEVSNRP